MLKFQSKSGKLMDCCKDLGVAEDCLGKCRIMGARSWPDYTGCEPDKSKINTCWHKGNFICEPLIFLYLNQICQELRAETKMICAIFIL